MQIEISLASGLRTFKKEKSTLLIPVFVGL